MYPGGLVCSRTIGDFDAKSGNIVSHAAEVQTIELTSDDVYLCLASDGLWDVVSNKQVAHLVKTKANAAHELIDVARKRRTADNVTVVVIHF